MKKKKNDKLELLKLFATKKFDNPEPEGPWVPPPTGSIVQSFKRED